MKIRVFVVDDDPRLTQLVREALSGDFTVQAAREATEAM